MTFRDLKNRSRKKLHEAMSYAAYLYTGSGSSPVPVNVRTHFKVGALQGDMKGTSLSYAEQIENPLKILFWAEELPSRPLRGSVIMLSSDEGYLVELAHPPYAGTITVEVVPLPETRLSMYQAPDE